MTETKETKAPEKEKTSTLHKILTVVGIVLCVILLPILIINITLIIKSYTSPDKVPSIGGWAPLIVLTDSMAAEPANIKGGSLIFVKSGAPEEVAVGDVIAFFDPASKSGAILTHRVIEVVTTEDGKLEFITKGDANNAADKDAVPAANLVGEYQFQIPGAGTVAMFMQTTKGLIVCVVIPLVLLVGYDMLRRKLYEKSKKKDTDALMAELEALKAEKAQQENSEE